jgi:flagellar hook-associated protein 2
MGPVPAPEAFMSTSSSVIFNGNSRYSQDFQSVIDRSVAIASLPITQLTSEKSSLTDQSSALSGLVGKFTDLQTAVQNLEAALGQSSFQYSVSAPDVLSATLSSGAMEGTYSVEVQDAGAYASSMTKAAWVAGAQAPTYQLVVGNSTVGITAASDDASAVAAAINEKAGDKVRATVINVGGADADYRLVLQSTHLGDLTPQLLASGADVQQEQSAGRVAKYVVGGSNKVVESDTRTVNIATGLSVTLEGSDPGSQVDITVSRSSSALTTALSAFASAYNAAAGAVDQQRGTSGGALSGESIVFDLANALRSLGTWSESGSSLDQIGLELDSSGKLSFDTVKFSQAGGDTLATASKVLGSSSTSGFLKLATNTLAGLTATDTGELSAAITAVQGQSKDTDNRIADEQDRVDALKERLQTQMANADALIASMEQQYTFVSNMFQSMQVAAEHYK